MSLRWSYTYLYISIILNRGASCFQCRIEFKALASVVRLPLLLRIQAIGTPPESWPSWPSWPRIRWDESKEEMIRNVMKCQILSNRVKSCQISWRFQGGKVGGSEAQALDSSTLCHSPLQFQGGTCEHHLMVHQVPESLKPELWSPHSSCQNNPHRVARTRTIARSWSAWMKALLDLLAGRRFKKHANLLLWETALSAKPVRHFYRDQNPSPSD